jgi:diaminopimelate decarboxylase
MENIDFVKVVEKFGSPLYIYEADKIKSQFKRLSNAFKNVEKLRINYAVKALSNISILKLMKKLGSGIDTVSIQEVKLGIKAGFNSNRIIFTPNGVNISEIEEVSKLGVQINIDNLSILESFGNKYPKTPVCIRLTLMLWLEEIVIFL